MKKKESKRLKISGHDKLRTLEKIPLKKSSKEIWSFHNFWINHISLELLMSTYVIPTFSVIAP